MRIIIDVMSGDNAPHEMIKGTLDIAASVRADFTMVGDETVINRILGELGADITDDPHITIADAKQIVTMHDAPLCVVREKSDSSMAKGLRMLAEGEGDAFISAGNTGALHAGSTLIVRRIKGVKRSAIATFLPFRSRILLIDAGANTEVTKEQLEQFAVMGSIYVKKMLDVAYPRVGLANIGTESTKGTKELIEAYEYLSESDNINFIGNVEGSQIPFSPCDVLVCNGLTGNTILKVTEGVCKYLFMELKDTLSSNIFTKASSLPIKGKLTGLKQTFSASDIGGAPLLGISKPVFKAHGSSKAEDICGAVKQVMHFINEGIIKDISSVLTSQNEGANTQ